MNTDPNIELKECPHCKHAAEMRQRALNFRDAFLPYWYVACPVCGARGGIGSNSYEAVFKWNCRSAKKWDELPVVNS